MHLPWHFSLLASASWLSRPSCRLYRCQQRECRLPSFRVLGPTAEDRTSEPPSSFLLVPMCAGVGSALVNAQDLVAASRMNCAALQVKMAMYSYEGVLCVGYQPNLVLLVV